MKNRIAWILLIAVAVIVVAYFTLTFLVGRTNRFDLIEERQAAYEIHDELLRFYRDGVSQEEAMQLDYLTNSTDYFMHLMDMDNYDTQSWNPRIFIKPEKVFTNQSGGSGFLAKWNVVKGDFRDFADTVPVVISGNVDVSELLGNYSYSHRDIIFDNSGGLIMVRNNGTICMLNMRKAPMSYIYEETYFDYTTNTVPQNKSLKYLTPTSEVYPKQE